MSYCFDNHAHTWYSNIRLLDCISKPEALLQQAVDIGLTGIAITDHESLGSHVKVNQFAEKLRETNPNFTIALGNEIYLVNERGDGQKYYHFILIAKDAFGYRGIKELSSIAWYNGYFSKGLERVPLLKQELKEVMVRYKGHIIATTACIGGELGSTLLKLRQAEEAQNTAAISSYRTGISAFVSFCIEVFGKDDFYLEVAPACSTEQIYVNKRIKALASSADLKLCCGSDSHYIKKEDRFVHKAYLNSKNGEREIDDFYEYCWLQSEQERREHLRKSFDDDTIDYIFACGGQMQQSIEFFSLHKSQSVEEIEVKDYPKSAWWGVNNPDADDMEKYPIVKSLFTSDNIQERYWINQCWEGLEKQGIDWRDHEEYVARLEEEADIKRAVGERLNTCIFAYPNFLQHYIDLFWECGSTVGAGRGSSCSGLNHELLGITQLDPIQWQLPFWRYMNKDRAEMPDIDLDLAPSKIQAIFKAIRKERGELGLIQVCTYGTEGTKSAILTACRGYRSKDYPDGIDVDTAQYMSGLIPSERGFLWSIKDVVKGNPEKGRKPVKEFINTVNQYPGLLDIITSIDGVVNKRSSHASGVVFFSEDKIYDTAAIMRTPKGALITQWDLHDQEYCGSVKYDFLLTSVQDEIIQTIELLQKDNVIDPSLSLREVYNKYLHPSVIPQDDPAIWSALANGDVIGCFQFDSSVGAQAAKKIAPKSMMEMADANGLMRLMTSEKGAETPMDKYVRFKNNISLWYDEMTRYGLTKDEQKTLEPHFLRSYGVPPSQEQVMTMLQDPNICGFTLAEANAARKVIGKKQMDKIPALHQKVLDQAKSDALGRYVWEFGIGPSMGYAFSIIHALAYSFVGLQTLYLATHFNPIYWNTAYLIVQSGAIDPEASEQTDYSKVAKAIGEARAKGINVSLVDINHSDFGFVPDVEHNAILYGLKGLSYINNDFIKEIKEGRPYSSLYDFYLRRSPAKQAMMSLIKGGAFDQFGDRYEAMIEYIWLTCDKKKRLTLQNLPSLIKYDIIPHEDKFTLPRRVYEFNRYLKACCKVSEGYIMNERTIAFLNEIEQDGLMFTDNMVWFIDPKKWDKVYQGYMDVFREWIAADKEAILDKLNNKIFMEDWQKYATGNLSSWEMQSLCFYYHEHELAHINKFKYGIVDYSSLPYIPVVEKTFKRGEAYIPIYKLSCIIGTVIAKDKTKSTIALLTTDGVVNVKFRKEHFAAFDRQVSQVGADGKKHVVEKSWMSKGNMIMVQGMRRGDEFVAKKYAASNPPHQLYHIDEIKPNGDITLRSERRTGEIEDAED